MYKEFSTTKLLCVNIDMKKIDFLIESIMSKKSPLVVGLDPIWEKIPQFYKEMYNATDTLDNAGDVIFNFNKDIIDAVYNLVPAVKPQIAYYEAYGLPGLLAFDRTVKYAKSKNLLVIEDGKRNDISSTAEAYAKGHLGESQLINRKSPIFDVDFLTVTPFLGSDSITPFFNVCQQYDKGIFILVKTSNPSSWEIQNAKNSDGKFVYEMLAEYINNAGQNFVGNYGYSSIGAVVGATHPTEARQIRQLLTNNFFLVPGYGMQGGTVTDILNCFNEDGLGALINSSRGILYSHLNMFDNNCISHTQYIGCIINSVNKANNEIYTTLRSNYPNMIY